MTDMIDGQFVPRRADVASIQIDGQVAAAAPRGEFVYSHWLDPIGSVVWNCIDGTSTVGEIADDLSAGFGVATETARADVLELTRALGRTGLLANVEPEQPADPERGSIANVPMGTETGIPGPAVVIHWSPDSGFCVALGEDLAQLQPRLRAHGREIVLIARGTPEANEALLHDLGLECQVVLDENPPLFAGLGAPCAYRVDADGRVDSYLAVGADMVLAVVRHEAKGASG